MSEPKKITLQYPIEVDGANVEALTMRRPLVRDLRAAQQAAGSAAATADVEIRLFANLCELAPDAFDPMDLGDYRQVQETYEGFLSRGSTGAARASS